MTVYQTSADLSREDLVAEEASKKWNCAQIKLEKLGFIDRAFVRDGEVKAYAEIKTRTNAHDKYDEYLIDLKKIEHGKWVSDYDGVPFVLVVKFTDGIWWVRINDDVRYRVGKGGRVDRGDANDIDTCAFIPMRYWRKM